VEPFVVGCSTRLRWALDAPSSELADAIDDTRSKAASAWLMATLVVIIALMVFKPGN
jgi:hypothetical protein